MTKPARLFAATMTLAALFGGCFVSGFARASDDEIDVGGIPTAMQCNGCSTSMILDKATAAGQGDRYYYNLVNDAINHVVTECEHGGGGTIVCDAYLDDVPQAIASKFADYRTLWLQNGSSEGFNQQVAINIPSGGPVGSGGKPTDNGYINAFDAVTLIPLDDEIVSYLDNPLHYTGFYAALLLLVEPLGNPIVQFDKLTLVVVVVFNDHSKRTYKFDKSVRTFVAVKGSARDANGNDVPEEHPPAGHSYLFNRDPSNNRYDERNVTQILPVLPPGLPFNGCIQEKWDGQSLTCVLPRP